MSSILDPFGVKSEVEKKLGAQREEEPPKEEQKEGLQEEIDYKAKYEKFKDFDTDAFEVLKPIILEEEGEEIGSKIANLATKHKEYKTKIGELTEKEKAREAWFRENQILHSREFQENYELPVKKSVDLYNALLGETDKEGKPVREDVWVKYRKAIWNDGKELTAAQIKAINKNFSDGYHQKFGDAPELPSIREIMDSRDELIDAQYNRIQAIQNWEKEVELRTAQQKNQETEREAEIRKAKEIENRQKYDVFKKEIKYDAYSEFFDKEVIDSKAEEMRIEFEDAMSGKNVPKLEEYFEMLHKAKLFDDLLNKSKELNSIVKEVKKGRREIGDGQPKEEERKKEEPGAMIKLFKL
jgi:hypothetical protein